MNKKIKNFITILLILIFTSPTFAEPYNSYSTKKPRYDYSGVYVNEEISVPITKIGIPREIFENQEEVGLEISWNKWRANVFNDLAYRIQNISIELAEKLITSILELDNNNDIYNFPHNFMCLATAKINSDRTVENVITMIIPKESFDIQPYHVYASKNSKIYMYNSEARKYYRWFYQGEPIDFNIDNGNGDEKVIKKLLSNGKIYELSREDVLFPTYLEKVASKIKGLSGRSIIEFPAQSKRKYVNIYFGTTDIIEIHTIRKATEDMYNDIERYK